MKALNELLKNGAITQEQYHEKLQEYAKGHRDAVSQVKSYRDALISLVKEGIEKETEAFRKLIDAKKKDLQATKEYANYAKSLRDKGKEIDSIKAQIAALEGNENAFNERRRLQSQLQRLEDDYHELRQEHEYDTIVKGYDDQVEAFEEKQNEQLKRLDSDLDYQEEAIRNMLDKVSADYTEVYAYLGSLSESYNLQMTDALTGPWKDAESAARNYQKAVNDVTASAKINTAPIPASPPAVMGTGAQEKAPDLPQQPQSGQSDSSSGSEPGLVSSLTSTLYSGLKGDNVRRLQKALNLLGVTDDSGGRLAEDGSFGPKTNQAVVKFQRQHGLQVDGRIGPASRAKFKALGFSKGGFIDARSIGEDGYAMVKHGEAVLTVEQAQWMKTLVSHLDPLNHLVNNTLAQARSFAGERTPEINLHYDSMLRVDGSVDKGALPELESLLRQSADYTVRMLRNNAKKLGVK